MKIEVSRWLGEEAIILENSQILAVILPKYGAKIASLYHKEQKLEVLFQNPKCKFCKANYDDDFESFEACGFDDTFPTIDRDQVEIDGERIAYPDHGEIWSAAFDYSISGKKLDLLYRSSKLNYLYRKEISLQGNCLICNYSIKNIGVSSFPYLWTMHCLVNYEEGMKLIFPQGVNTVRNVIDSEVLGKAGKLYSFPLGVTDNGVYDFTKVPSPDTNTMEKYYVEGKVKEGKCGYYYPSKDILVEIDYDAKQFPYLGFWVTTGGFRGDYNCALEPTSGYYDNIHTATRNNAISYLTPKEEINFKFVIALIKEVSINNGNARCESLGRKGNYSDL